MSSSNHSHGHKNLLPCVGFFSTVIRMGNTDDGILSKRNCRVSRSRMEFRFPVERKRIPLAIVVSVRVPGDAILCHRALNAFHIWS